MRMYESELSKVGQPWVEMRRAGRGDQAERGLVCEMFELSGERMG